MAHLMPWREKQEISIRGTGMVDTDCLYEGDYVITRKETVKAQYKLKVKLVSLLEKENQEKIISYYKKNIGWGTWTLNGLKKLFGRSEEVTLDYAKDNLDIVICEWQVNYGSIW